MTSECKRLQMAKTNIKNESLLLHDKSVDDIDVLSPRCWLRISLCLCCPQCWCRAPCSRCPGRPSASLSCHQAMNRWTDFSVLYISWIKKNSSPHCSLHFPNSNFHWKMPNDKNSNNLILSVSGPHHGDHHLHAGGGQCPVQCGRHDPQDVILQDDRLLPPLQPQHHHPGHGMKTHILYWNICFFPSISYRFNCQKRFTTPTWPPIYRKTLHQMKMIWKWKG